MTIHEKLAKAEAELVNLQLYGPDEDETTASFRGRIRRKGRYVENLKDQLTFMESKDAAP